MIDPVARFCPACKYKNEADALVCVYCGASLDENPKDKTTEKMAHATGKAPGGHGVLSAIGPIPGMPASGIAVYFVGESKPITTLDLDDFVLGRQVTGASDDIVDLSQYGGLEMGVSRRHAWVRKTVIGYEVVDLNSTNGTWLNEKRLVPNKTYPLNSGDQIRLGQMLLIVLFQTPSGA